MNPPRPTFRYPGELPPPRRTDWPLLTVIGIVTIGTLLGWAYAIARMAGWVS